jgi:hypothetical protein
MKKILYAASLLWLPLAMQAQFNLATIVNKVKEKIKVPDLDKLFNFLDGSSPVSTNFDDAIYEVDQLSNYEPSPESYRPLDIQPVDASGGFRLSSGVYTMKARSFCLKAGTYGPSRGDGHLYAPLKGKKADFVKTILSRYAAKPNLEQHKIQVLLWAVIAGADMNNLGSEHLFTLTQLFTPGELLTYKGKDWFSGITDKDINKIRQQISGQIPQQLQMVLNANNSLRQMLSQNTTFQQLEQIAILAGIAPASDMVRTVTRGRWSYHPAGYFIRYFPEGYAQTQVDVFVPFEGNVDVDKKGKVTAVRNESQQQKTVIFNPAEMVAVPANRSSQRIGISPVPVKPCEGRIAGGQDLARQWKDKALEYMMNLQGKSSVRNYGITCAYAQMYMNDPVNFKWAGLAALVSGKIGERQNDGDLKTGLKEDIFSGNRAVFDDLFWQHKAFNEKGITEIERLYCSKAINEEAYSAWRKITEGNVWEGNLDLLYYEQKNILQPALYAGNNRETFWWWIDSWIAKAVKGNILVSPVPGESSVFPGNNISNFEERWNWIKDDIMPAWEKFESNPENNARLREALHKVCADCCR